MHSPHKQLNRSGPPPANQRSIYGHGRSEMRIAALHGRSSPWAAKKRKSNLPPSCPVRRDSPVWTSYARFSCCRRPSLRMTLRCRSILLTPAAQIELTDSAEQIDSSDRHDPRRACGRWWNDQGRKRRWLRSSIKGVEPRFYCTRCFRKIIILSNASFATSFSRSEATKQCCIWRFRSARGSTKACSAFAPVNAESISRISA